MLTSERTVLNGPPWLDTFDKVSCTPIGSMGLVYLPTFTININQNVGRYSIHGSYGTYIKIISPNTRFMVYLYIYTLNYPVLYVNRLYIECLGSRLVNYALATSKCTSRNSCWIKRVIICPKQGLPMFATSSLYDSAIFCTCWVLLIGLPGTFMANPVRTSLRSYIILTNLFPGR